MVPLPPVAVTVLGSGTIEWLGDRDDRVLLRCGRHPAEGPLALHEGCTAVAVQHAGPSCLAGALCLQPSQNAC